MGAGEWVKDKLVGQGPSKKGKTLEDLGLNALRSEDVGNRRKMYDGLKAKLQEYTLLNSSIPIFENDKPKKDAKGNTVSRPMTAEEKLDKMILGMVEINSMLMDISAPWGAAGTEAWYAEAMKDWDTIYTSCLNIAATDKEILKAKENDGVETESTKMAMVDMFYSTFYQRDFLKYAQRIYTYSWRRDDMETKWAIINNQPPITLGRPGEGLNKLDDPNNPPKYGGDD